MFRTLLLAAIFAACAPLNLALAQTDLQTELEQLYQRYNELVGDDKVDEAIALRTDEMQAEIKADLAKGTAEQQERMMNMFKGMTPDTFVAEHVDANGEDRATLFGIGSKVMPVGPEAGKLKRVEMMVDFVRVGDGWRIDMPRFLGDPDAVKRVEDVAYEPIENYDQSRDVNMGGRVVRVALEADHTLVVVRMLDEEQALYLPDQAYLKEKGFKVELLQPYANVEGSGYPHKTNSQKVWITGLSVQ